MIIIRTASIVLNNCTRNFDKEYDYIIPDDLADKVQKGVRVIVPFGVSNKSSEGYVLHIKDTSDMEDLKSIKKVIDDTPVLTEEAIEIARWMKEKYICTFADAIRCFIPSGMNVKALQYVKLIRDVQTDNKNWNKIIEFLRKNDSVCELAELRKVKVSGLSGILKELEQSGLVEITERYSSNVQEKYVKGAYLTAEPDEIMEDMESGRIRTIQQIRVLEMLLDNECISTADLIRFSGVSPGVLNTLKKNGYIDFKDIEVKRDPFKFKHYESTEPKTPTAEQAKVLEEVDLLLGKKEFSEVLLHGVTGSGKTEVYLQLIKHTVDMGREAIVLVPEISLTPQMVERFKGRFQDKVAVLHSRLSPGERFDQWKFIREGKVKVVVGARSAVFAPLKNIGIIIIDEEHENTYKSEIVPKYHASEIARKRCELNSAILLYGSATPSVETYYRAETGEIKMFKMTERPNKMHLPKVEIVDMRKELSEGNKTIFSKSLYFEMKKNIEENLQTILFLNRRGHSSFVICRDCGFVIKCRYCNISMTYHANDKRLICHYCGYTVINPQVCPKCKSNNIRYFGTGTQKVEEEVRKFFSDCSVLRMDMDTTGFKNAHELILESFKKDNINVLVGTQMIAKGHDFPNVTLVGVIAADSILNMGDYKATERTFQLITQVAGRAGRGEHPGKVIVQTYNTENFSIKAACTHNYDEFYRQEIILRKELNYPPFTNIAVILLSGSNDKVVYSKAEEVKKNILNLPNVECCQVLGPARSPLSRIKNRFRWRMVLKCEDKERLIWILAKISDDFYKSNNRRIVALSTDINPSNLL